MARSKTKRTKGTRGRRGFRGGGWRRDDAFDGSSTAAISNGPVTFELDLARAWGMSPRVMRTLWNKITPIINRASAAAVRAHPERWREEDVTGQYVFVGETPADDPNLQSAAWTREQKQRAGVRPLNRPARKGRRG